MSDGTQARILSVDDSGVLHQVLRVALAGAVGGSHFSITPARLAEALAIARLERASEPYPIVFLALPSTAARAAVQIAALMLDNGVGIALENHSKIFAHSFTTRPGGHGFRLHSSALAGKEMGGSITVHSAGVGKGAMFSLDLPAQPSE